VGALKVCVAVANSEGQINFRLLNFSSVDLIKGTSKETDCAEFDVRAERKKLKEREGRIPKNKSKKRKFCLKPLFIFKQLSLFPLLLLKLYFLFYSIQNVFLDINIGECSFVCSWEYRSIIVSILLRKVFFFLTIKLF